MPGPNMEASILTTKELCARLVALAEHSQPELLSTEARAIWRLVCKEAADRLLRPEGRDTARLDWLQRVKDATFSAANSHAKDISKICLFTIETQHIRADSVRDVIDEAMRTLENHRK